MIKAGKFDSPQGAFYSGGMADCYYKAGSVIEAADLSRILQAGDGSGSGSGCIIEEGAIIRLRYDDEDRSPAPDQVTAPHRRQHREITMQETTTGSGGDTPTPTQSDTPSQTPLAASVAQPATPFDLNGLVSATGGSGGIAIVLALIAVGGGAAAWKFWTKISEQHHEHKMKMLDIQQQEVELKMAAQSGDGPQPQQCVVANAALQARVEAAEGRIESLSATLAAAPSAPFDADFDVIGLDKRVKKLEKALKATNAKPTKPTKTRRKT